MCHKALFLSNVSGWSLSMCHNSLVPRHQIFRACPVALSKLGHVYIWWSVNWGNNGRC